MCVMAVVVIAGAAAGATTITTLATPSAVAAAAMSPPRWVSAWGKCTDEEAIVAFLSKPANAGVFKSLFM